MTALLKVNGLVRRYGALRAVDGVDLDLRPGARHALIGPNGAGKSTLLNLLAGTARPSAGRIRLAGRDITATGPAARARLGIARTFQTPAVLGSLTVLDNLVAGAWRHRPARRRWREYRHRELVHHGLLDALGLDAVAHRPASTLPHGRQRLLEIAITLAAAPTVLLLDEPAAGLGDDDLHRLLAALRRLPDGMAVLLVEHNQDLVAAFAGTVTVLHQGRVLATGSPREIHAHPAVAEAYLGTTRGPSAPTAASIPTTAGKR